MAEEADRAEALESVSSRVSVWHASSPEGAADLWATASSADLRLFGLCVWGFGLWLCGSVFVSLGGAADRSR